MRFGWEQRIGKLVITSPNCMGSSSKRRKKGFPKKKHKWHGKRQGF